MRKNEFLTKRNEPVTMNLTSAPEATGVCNVCGEDTYQTDDRTYHCHTMNRGCYAVPIQETGVPRKPIPDTVRGRLTQ